MITDKMKIRAKEAVKRTQLYMQRWGASQVSGSGIVYDWRMNTPLGLLGFSLAVDKFGFNIYGKFLEANYKILRDTKLSNVNPFSGKWNHFYSFETLKEVCDPTIDFRQSLKRLMECCVAA